MVDDSESILEENWQLFVIRDELVLGFLPTRTSVMIIIHAIFIYPVPTTKMPQLGLVPGILPLSS